MISLELTKKKGETDIRYCYNIDILVDKWIDLVLGMLALCVKYGVKIDSRGIQKHLFPSFTISLRISDMKLQ